MNQAHWTTRMKKRSSCASLWLIQLLWHWGNPVGHMWRFHAHGLSLARHTVTVNRELQLQKYSGPQGLIWQRKIVNHTKLRDNWVKGWTFKFWKLKFEVWKQPCSSTLSTVKLDEHMPAWVQSVFTMKILLYFTIAVLVPSTKTLTTGAQRSDFIAKLTKDYRLDLSTQHMKDLTKASPSFCMRNDSRRALNIHMGAYFICKALSVEIIIMSTPMKVTKTHLKTTGMKGQGSSITAKVWILLSVQYLWFILALSFLIYLQKL